MSDAPRDPLKPAGDDWLDRMLDAAAPVEPSAALRRAVAEIPLRHPRAARSRAFGLPVSVMRFALFAAFASAGIGAWLGSQTEVLPDVAIGEDVATEDEAWDELALLAFADDLDAELEP